MVIKYIFYNTAEPSLRVIRDFITEKCDYKIRSLTALYLGDKYSAFIEDIYKEGWIPKEDLTKKQNFVKENGRHLNAYIFEVELDNVTEVYDERKKRKVYAEAENLKRTLRQAFKGNVPRYFHDILVHSPDCEQENTYINNLIQEYKDNTPFKTKDFLSYDEPQNVR